MALSGFSFDDGTGIYTFEQEPNRGSTDPLESNAYIRRAMSGNDNRGRVVFYWITANKRIWRFIFLSISETFFTNLQTFVQRRFGLYYPDTSHTANKIPVKFAATRLPIQHVNDRIRTEISFEER